MFRLVVFSYLFLATIAASYHRHNSSKHRIIGGHNTEITDVPYQVSISYGSKHVCGGSIIGAKHILTAAHCVEKKNSSLFTVRAGSNYHSKGGQKVDVVNITSHPNYDTKTGDYDAAVLVLKEPLTAADGVGIATLTYSEPKAKEMVLISGWGSMEKNTGVATHLQSVEVPVVSKRLCKKKYGESNITDRMFCASQSTSGKDFCKGDSGGPATINGKLAGIVSWGEDCGDPKFPGVYTKVSSILPWITAQTR